MLARALARLSASLLLVAVARAGDLWTVDQTGNGDFTTLQAAYAAAADGDTLLVVGDYTASTFWLSSTFSG